MEKIGKKKWNVLPILLWLVIFMACGFGMNNGRPRCGRCHGKLKPKMTFLRKWMVWNDNECPIFGGNNLTCDECNEPNIDTTKSFDCSRCDYDLCGDCHEKSVRKNFKDCSGCCKGTSTEKIDYRKI
jgi:hypothetical protein